MLPWCFLCSPGLLVIGGLQFLGEERQAKECDLVGISSHKIRSWEAFHKEPDRKYFRHCQPHAVPVTAALHRPAGAAFPPEASWRTRFPCLFQLSVLLLTDSLRWPRLALNSEFRDLPVSTSQVSEPQVGVTIPGFYRRMGIKLKISCILDKHSTKLESQSPFQFLGPSQPWDLKIFSNRESLACYSHHIPFYSVFLFQFEGQL